MLRFPAPLSDIEPAPTDWYANTFPIVGRKSLLLTRSTTLFSVFVPDVAVADVRPPGPLVVSRIHAALHIEGLPTDALGALDPADVTAANTSRRTRTLRPRCAAPGATSHAQQHHLLRLADRARHCHDLTLRH